MVLVSLNAIFAYLALRLAWRAWGRAIPFLDTGWSTISAEVRHPDFRYHVERRRAISVAGRFLFGGLLWAGVCAAAVGSGMFFGIQAVRLLLI